MRERREHGMLHPTIIATLGVNRSSMEFMSTGPRWVRPLALVGAILVIGWIMLTSPRSAATVAPPNALGNSVPVALQGQLQAQAAPTARAPAPAPLDGREPVVTIGSLALYTSGGSYSAEQVQALAQPLNEALTYVSDRTDMQPSAPINIIFERREPCSLDGAAYTEKRTIFLYICPSMPAQRAVNILAHEFVHQLAYDRYGASHMQADLVLSEGLATWGAGKYWLGREADFRGFVQRNYAPNLLPLGSHYQDYGTIDAMNRLYYQWASLVDFIIATRGRETFDALYASGQGMQPNTADYSGVVGVDLNGLEGQWKEWLNQ